MQPLYYIVKLQFNYFLHLPIHSPIALINVVTELVYMLFIFQAGVTQYTVPPVVHLQSEFVPNDYFIPTLVISIVCPIVSISTIFFTVAAIICSILVSKMVIIFQYLMINNYLKFHYETVYPGKGIFSIMKHFKSKIHISTVCCRKYGCH